MKFGDIVELTEDMTFYIRVFKNIRDFSHGMNRIKI